MVKYFYKHQVESLDYKALYNKFCNIFYDITSSKKLIGLYFIYNDKNELMYVGQSKNIASRLTTHIRKKYKYAKRIDVMSFDDNEENMLTDAERYYITKLQPIDNILVDELHNTIEVEEYIMREFGVDSVEDIHLVTPTLTVMPLSRVVFNDEFELDVYENMRDALKYSKTCTMELMRSYLVALENPEIGRDL